MNLRSSEGREKAFSRNVKRVEIDDSVSSGRGANKKEVVEGS